MAMPGIQTKLNIPKTQSPKEVASTAVLHASRATTFSKPTSSSGNIFGSTGTRYGISAQRSKVGTGQHLNAKAFYNNNNTSALRDMNSRAFFSVDSYAPVFIEHNHNGNKMSGLEKALMWTTAGLGIAGMAMSTINAFKTPDNSIKGTSLVDSEIPTADGVKGSNVPESLTAMKGAKDSVSLDAAIVSAKADKDALPGKITSANTELSALTGKTEGLKTNMENTQADLDANTEKIRVASEKVNELGNKVKSLEDKVASLQAAYDNADQTDSADLQNQLDQAKAELEDAKNQLNVEKEVLEDLNRKKPILEQDAADAKVAYDKNLEAIDAKQKELEGLKQQKKDLDAEIPKQEKRLAELKKKEDDELTKLGSSISALQGEIGKLNGSITTNDVDGYSVKDKKTKAKVDKKQTKLDGLKARQAELQKRKAIRNLPTEPGFPQFKKGVMPDGTTAYFVGGEEVTQEDYQAKLEQAKNS